MHCHVGFGIGQCMLQVILRKDALNNGWMLVEIQLENVGNIPYECKYGVR